MKKKKRELGKKVRNYFLKKNQMDVFELKNAITEIKHTMDGFKSKLDMAK